MHKVVQKRASNVITLHVFIPLIDFLTIILVDGEQRASNVVAGNRDKRQTKSPPQASNSGRAKISLSLAVPPVLEVHLLYYYLSKYSLPTHQARICNVKHSIQNKCRHTFDALPLDNGGLPARITSFLLSSIKSILPASRSGGLLAHRPEGGIPHSYEMSNFHHHRLADAHNNVYSSLATTILCDMPSIMEEAGISQVFLYPIS